MWKRKFKKNVLRDEESMAALKSLGWNVIVIWECEIKNDKFLKKIALK